MSPRESTNTCELRVGGMDCPSCADGITRALRHIEGVEDVSVNVMGGRVQVKYADRQPPRRELATAIRQLGFRVEEESDNATDNRTFWEERGRLTLAVASGILLAAGLALGWLNAGRPLEIVALAMSAIAGGWFIAPRGWRAVRSGVLDMNVLMTVAAAGAAAIGEWAEGASVMFLFAVAQLLESFSLDRARNAIKGLMALSPAEAAVRRNGREITVPVADVRVGERIVVRPGQKIPLDGVVRDGASSVNQAPITGESIPVDKAAGAEVFAGTINGHGVLEIETTKVVEDTTLARIIHTVEEAQATRAPAQSFVDRFAAFYTPAVVVVALVLVFVPPLAGLGSWSTWFYRALAMLVVACPCALVISTPVSIVSGLAGAARAGILIKGGLHLENAATATALAFDKTGTLTEGRPVVTDVLPVDGVKEMDVLRLAAALEQGSEHPLARAVVVSAFERGLTVPPVTEFQALVGRGVQATVEGKRLYLGNERLARDRAFWQPGLEALVERLERDGKTAVVLGDSDHPIGVLGIGDQLRPAAARAVRELRDLGIREIRMLTGDNEETARAVANRVGLTEYHAGLMPDDKVRIVREMERTGERVVFVGDGVNDAPALAAATVGIAMGAAGTDVALETADIALMADDLSKLSAALRFSRKTLRIIKQNIAFSLVNKAVFVVLAVGGWATLWMAVASDMGASLVVIANGLRALRVGRSTTA